MPPPGTLESHFAPSPLSIQLKDTRQKAGSDGEAPPFKLAPAQRPRNEAKKLVFKYCQMSTSTNTQLDVVTLDNEISRGVASAPNMWICNDVIKLSTADRDILLNPVGYLNDSIIAAAQDLLKNKSVSQGGFQDTVLGLTCNFQIETEEFVQILFNGRNHWLVISTVGAVDDSEVFVYDSVHVCVNQTIKNQIAALLATKRKEIKLKFMDVQIQSGGCDWIICNSICNCDSSGK